MNGEYYVTQEEFISVSQYIPDTTFVDYTRVKSLNTKLAEYNPLFKVTGGDDHFKLRDLLHIWDESIVDAIERHHDPDIITAFKVLTIHVSSDTRYNIHCFVPASIILHASFTSPVELNGAVKFNTSDMFITVANAFNYLFGKMSNDTLNADFNLSELNKLSKYIAGNIFRHSHHEPIFGISTFVQIIIPELINMENIRKNNALVDKINAFKDILNLELDKFVQNELMPWSASIDNKEDK